VDIKREKIAIAEAKRLKIPVVAMVDTNVNPEEIDYPIPANDDAFKSIALSAGRFLKVWSKERLFLSQRSMFRKILNKRRLEIATIVVKRLPANANAAAYAVR
jgi:ribosomal protein S2